MDLESFLDITTLKVVHNGFARRIKVPYGMDWYDFERKVCRLFDLPPPLVTSYIDSMGVAVIVDNGDDFSFFLDEECTGRLDVVTGLESSEALDWTVVRNFNGDIDKGPEHANRLYSSCPHSEKSDLEINQIYSGPVSSRSSVHDTMLSSDRDSSSQPEIFARVPTPQTAVKDGDFNEPNFNDAEELSVSENGSQYESALPVLGEPSNGLLLEASKSRSTCGTVSSGVASNVIEEPVAEHCQVNTFNSTTIPKAENVADHIEPEANVDSVAVQKIQETNYKHGHLLHFDSSEDNLLSQPQWCVGISSIPSLEGLLESEPYNQNEKSPVKVQGKGSKEENTASEVFEKVGTIKTQTPSNGESKAFVDVTTSTIPPGPLASIPSASEPGNKEPTCMGSMPTERKAEPAISKQARSEPEVAEQHSETAKIPTFNTLADINERLSRSHALRRLCYKFKEDFQCDPNPLLTILELFTNQISHGVPIDLQLVESDLYRTRPSNLTPPGLTFEEVASNLGTNVGEMVTRVGTSLSKFLDDELPQLFSSIANFSNGEKNKVSTPQTEAKVSQPQRDNSEIKTSESETQPCHLPHGCKHKRCHKRSSGVLPNHDDSHAVCGSLASDIAEFSNRRHHRCCRHKHKPHTCSRRRVNPKLPQESMPSKVPIESQPKASTATHLTLSSGELHPSPKFLPEFCSSVIPPSLFYATQISSRPGMLAEQPKKQGGDLGLLESQRPYAKQGCLSVRAAAPNNPVEGFKSVCAEQDLGKDISPDDVSMICSLASLREMGFCDDAANLSALQASSGCIEAAVEALL